MTHAFVQAFPLSSPDEIAAFEAHLDEYVARFTSHQSFRHFSLVRCYECLQSDPNGSKIFASLVDIRIGLALLYCNSSVLSRLFNKTLPTTDNNTQVFSELEAFDLRMEMHSHANAYVLRLRSLWDKFMGILVLRLEPEKYEYFASAKRKKATFRKIFANSRVVPLEFVTQAEHVMQEFDDSFRTPEIHGTGSLRKSSFTWEDPFQSPANFLLGYWNFINLVAHVIGGAFDPIARSHLDGQRNNVA
jgi:hypothetical protein